MSEITRAALAAAISREREANRDWSTAAKRWNEEKSLLESENKALREQVAYLAVGEVREHNGSLMVIGALHPQIELDTLPIGSKVYIHVESGQ